MGYRDLEAFNLALLAKQGWRILKNPNSLMATILKEKYFPRVSLLEAPLGNKPSSFTWRSIWKSLKLLREGLIWRVGDGCSINLWGDCWLPSPHTYSIQSPIQNLHRDEKVNALIDPHTKWWNRDLLYELFSKEEITRICNIAPRPGDILISWCG
jgi:hypothetical protein